MRGLAKIGMALALAIVPVQLAAQGLGPNASEGEAFIKAVKDRDGAKATELASQPGSGVVNYRGYDGDTGLIVAVRQRESDWVGFILGKGADPNIGDFEGDTPLIIASGMGFEEAAAVLLRRGAKVDLTNRRGETALSRAVQARQPRIVELLLRAGADPDKPDRSSGYTPRDHAKRDTRNPQLLKLIESVKSTKKAVAGPSVN